MLPSHSHPSKAKKTSSRRRSSHSLSPAQYALKIQVLPNACPRVASRISKMMDAHIQRRSRRETYRSQRPEYSHPKPKWLSQFLSSSLWAFEPHHIPPIKPRGYQFQLSHANGLSRSKAISCHILSWSEGAQAQGMRTILCQSARVPSKPRALRGKGSQATGPGPIQVTSPF